MDECTINEHLPRICATGTRARLLVDSGACDAVTPAATFSGAVDDRDGCVLFAASRDHSRLQSVFQSLARLKSPGSYAVCLLETPLSQAWQCAKLCKPA